LYNTILKVLPKKNQALEPSGSRATGFLRFGYYIPQLCPVKPKKALIELKKLL